MIFMGILGKQKVPGLTRILTKSALFEKIYRLQPLFMRNADL